MEVDHVFCDAEAFGDVFFYLDSSSSSQTEQRHSRVILLKNIKLQIILSEILPPRTHTMHLIDDKPVKFICFVEILQN